MVKKELMKDSYMYDADKALFVVIVIDASHSRFKAGYGKMAKRYMTEFKAKLAENPEAMARIRIAVIIYGTQTKIVSGFTPAAEYEPEDNLCEDMGNTDTATALRTAFDLCKGEMEYYMSLNKPVIRGIVNHITDGLPTSRDEDMKAMVKEYDNYHRSSKNERKILIYSATQDQDALDRVSGYSDKSMLCESYEALVDSIRVIAETASILSGSIVETNPETGETISTLPDPAATINIPDSILEVRSRDKEMLISDMIS